MKTQFLASMLALSCTLPAVAAHNPPQADKPFADAYHVIYMPVKGAARLPTKANLTYHGGGVITTAHVVYIFWGPTFSNAASPDFAYAQTLQAYRNQFGNT